MSRVMLTWSSTSKPTQKDDRVFSLTRFSFSPFSMLVALTLFLLTLTGPFPLVQGASTVDPCATIGTKFKSSNLVLVSEVKACLRSFPYRANDAKVMLDSMTKILIDIYPSTNLAIKAHDWRQYSKTNLRKEIARIKNKKYSSDFDFHQDLSKVLYTLKDAHTGWYPDCFGNYFAFLNGLPMLQVWDAAKKTNIVKIAPKKVFQALASNYGWLLQATAKYLKVTNLVAYYGAQVVKMDGLSTSDYIKKRASASGLYRNYQARVNDLFFRVTSDSMLFGELMYPALIPSKDTLTLTIIRSGSKRQENITIPYVTKFYGFGFFNAQDYYNSYCRPYSKTLMNSTKAGGNARPTRLPPFLEPRKPLPESTRMQTKDLKASGLKILSSGALKVYLLPDGKTAIMVVPSFLYPDDQSATVESTLDYLYKGFKSLANSVVKRVIIDVSNNRGGFAVACSFLTQLFFPDKFPGFPIQYKAKAYAQEAYKKASKAKTQTYSAYDYRNFVDKSNKEFKSASSFFVPLRNKTQNNITDPYSSLFYVVDALSFYGNYRQKVARFNSRSILILTNGLCYSSCAIFSLQMRQLYKVKAVTIGGDSTATPFQMADGAAGFVQEFSSFYRYDVVELGLTTSSNAPSPLPVPGSLGFTFAQTYGPRSSVIPLEFLYEPGQYKLRYTEDSVVNDQLIWQQAARFFT